MKNNDLLGLKIIAYAATISGIIALLSGIAFMKTAAITDPGQSKIIGIASLAVGIYSFYLLRNNRNK